MSSNRPGSGTGYRRPSSGAKAKAGIPPQGGKPGSASGHAVAPATKKDQATRKIVGQYMIGKTIGEGTFGKVKIAVHIPTGEKVAVKILEKARIKEQADVKRVNREIKILKKASGINVIKMFEVLDTVNSVYLIMESCDGGELFDYIVSHKRVEERQACIFFHQIMDGLECIHKSDITHRDMKPENLLLKMTPSGWVIKIVDFGLSNTHEGGKLLTTACGSPCYAAPEMIAGKAYVGPVADMWSCGVILFALVCGYLPFEDANTSALYQKILAGRYTPAKFISPEVKDLIRKILEVKPNNRFRVEDVRRHRWYQAVPENQVPKDIISPEEAEQTKTEIFAKLQEQENADIMLIRDGLNSRACNGHTAMYFLLEQKYKNAMNKRKVSESKLRRNNPNTDSSVSTASKPGSAVIVPTTNGADSGSIDFVTGTAQAKVKIQSIAGIASSQGQGQDLGAFSSHKNPTAAPVVPKSTVPPTLGSVGLVGGGGSQKPDVPYYKTDAPKSGPTVQQPLDTLIAQVNAQNSRPVVPKLQLQQDPLTNPQKPAVPIPGVMMSATARGTSGTVSSIATLGNTGGLKQPQTARPLLAPVASNAPKSILPVPSVRSSGINTGGSPPKLQGSPSKLAQGQGQRQGQVQVAPAEIMKHTVTNNLNAPPSASAPVATVPMQVPAQSVVAPPTNMAQRSAGSANGGRRGKNLVATSVPAPVVDPNVTTTVATTKAGKPTTTTFINAQLGSTDFAVPNKLDLVKEIPVPKTAREMYLHNKKLGEATTITGHI